MGEFLTAAQMQAIENVAIDSDAITGLELMERAGRGVVSAIFAKWPELAKTSHNAVVLCGPGNNGGDGFVVARLLQEWGWEVAVFLYGDAEKLPPDALVNHERYRRIGKVRSILHGEKGHLSTSGPDVMVDALFGTGLTRPVPGDLQEQLFECHAYRPRNYKMVAVDIVSGLCSDSGRILSDGDGETRIHDADLTVTFHRRKICHVIGVGPKVSGQVKTVDIGLGSNPDAVEPLNGIVLDVDPAGQSSFSFDKGAHVQAGTGHKYQYGHALILAGGAGKGGAARLAARGALRIGSGVATVACPPVALQENAGVLDAVMVRSVKDADGLADALEDTRINALCLGPGLGQGRAKAMLPVALANGTADRAVVLDADALSAFGDEPEALFSFCRGSRVVMTPHAGEFARLFPDIAEKLIGPAAVGPAYSKVTACREAAARSGCVVVFKGADTVIAAPDGRCSINSAHQERSAPWLATAGSGDVLAGFITGLLARGFSPVQAAEGGVWLHVACALKFGPGLIAEDLSETLPAVFRDLGGD